MTERRFSPTSRDGFPRRRSVLAGSAWLVALMALLLTLAAPPLALAEGGAAQVTLSVRGGDLTYRLSSGTMEQISFDVDRSESTVTSGAVTLLVDDARGTHEGWAITIESTAFAYTGDAPGQNDIEAARATVIPGAPALLAGPTVDGVNAGAAGTLETRRTVLHAAAGAGSGRFQQELGIRLDIPAHSPAGTYSAMLTVSATSAPTGAD